MSPVEQAKHVYETEPCARCFLEDLELHLLHGYVFSTPGYFIMGRPVCISADDAQIVHPGFQFPRAVQDGWLIYLAAGENAFAEFMRLMPYPLPYVCWERRNKLRVYSIDWIFRKLEVATSIFSGHPSIQGRVNTEAAEAAEAGKAQDP